MRRRLAARERGQALVELAVVLPFVLLLLLGVLEFGLMFDVYLGVAHAAREGARAGVVPGGDDDRIRERVLAAAPQLDPSRLELAVSPPEGDRHPGDALTVQVDYRYTPVVPLLAPLWGGDVRMRSRYTMRIE